MGSIGIVLPWNQNCIATGTFTVKYFEVVEKIGVSLPESKMAIFFKMEIHHVQKSWQTAWLVLVFFTWGGLGACYKVVVST